MAFTHGIRCDVMDIFIESRTSKTAFKHFYQLQDKAWTCKIELVSEVCVEVYRIYKSVCLDKHGKWYGNVMRLRYPHLRVFLHTSSQYILTNLCQTNTVISYLQSTTNMIWLPLAKAQHTLLYIYSRKTLMDMYILYEERCMKQVLQFYSVAVEGTKILCSCRSMQIFFGQESCTWEICSFKGKYILVSILKLDE